MTTVAHILMSFKSGNITQAQAAAEIEELIELERVQLRDTFAVAALPALVAKATVHEHLKDVPKEAFAIADAMLEVRAATCTKSQTLAHYGEQARLAAREGGKQ